MFQAKGDSPTRLGQLGLEGPISLFRKRGLAITFTSLMKIEYVALREF
jgi:hypothetical protein